MPADVSSGFAGLETTVLGGPTTLRHCLAFTHSKIPFTGPAGIQLSPPHLGQRLRNGGFLPQSGQMIRSCRGVDGWDLLAF